MNRLNATHAEAWVELNGESFVLRTNLFSSDVLAHTGSRSPTVVLDIKEDVLKEVIKKLFPPVKPQPAPKPKRK